MVFHLGSFEWINPRPAYGEPPRNIALRRDVTSDSGLPS